MASVTAAGLVMANADIVATSTSMSASRYTSASTSASVYPTSPKRSTTSADEPEQRMKSAHTTITIEAQDMAEKLPELAHSGDTTEEADDEDDGEQDLDEEDANDDEDERKDAKTEGELNRDEHIRHHNDGPQAATATIAGASLTTAIVVDDDTEPDTEAEPEIEHSVTATKDTAHPSTTSTKRKAPAPSSLALSQQDPRPPRRRRLFAPPPSTAQSASRSRRTSPPPRMSPTRSSHAFSDVLRSSRKLRTVQQLERNPDASQVDARFAPLPYFANATVAAPVVATKAVEPPCAADTCPILLSLGLNPSETTEVPQTSTIYDPLARTHISFPTAAHARVEASHKHKHDHHAIHQAVHVWQRQKSRLSTLAGLVDDDWVKGEIKACVLQMWVVVGEAWRGLWYCGENEQNDGDWRKVKEDKENTCDSMHRVTRNTARGAESRVLRIKEEGVLYAHSEADPRSPMPMAKPRTPMAQRVGPTSPTKAGATSPKRRFHVFTDRDYKSAGCDKECATPSQLMRR